ncbi:ESPR-type extended signal peptide-containing protein [Succiniclasticum ruminis]|uniref:Head domain of trimeric autotransporter adhesin n=1 Tax=Succiniclasticum ruminis DSM 9236 TaxID=1123323 RepID=A0A1I1YQ99_9FIRM|nr:ESPR-type extended signal peptide-containing protein [Succiniclasticum ruminis]SFE20343.1 Head domain of trimeric autotransporter adhesin [Succiniclasticum ruminis DSM 9236]
MNKIFKVVWSKTKNSYVVVSEIAKRNGKCSSSLNKKLIAAFLAAGTVLSVTGSAWAEPAPVPGGYQITGRNNYVEPDGDSDAQTVFGSGNTVTGLYGTAWGYKNIAADSYATVWGSYNKAGQNKTDKQNLINRLLEENQIHSNETGGFGTNTTAWGSNTEAFGTDATAFGFKTKAYGLHATAWGTQTMAMGVDSTAFGLDTVAKGRQAVAWGEKTLADGSNATAFGEYTRAITSDDESKMGATAFGVGSLAMNSSATAFGGATTAQGEASTAFGSNSLAAGTFSTAFGENSYALGDNSLAALGGQTGSGSLGYNFPEDPEALAVNVYATKISVNAEGAVAIGKKAVAYRSYTYAIGNNTRAMAKNSLAIGNGAYAYGVSSSLIGTGSKIGGSSVNLQGVAASVYGAYNSVEAKSGVDFDGFANSVFGVGNLTSNANSSVVVGTGNTVQDSYEDLSDEITTVWDNIRSKESAYVTARADYDAADKAYKAGQITWEELQEARDKYLQAQTEYTTAEAALPDAVKNEIAEKGGRAIAIGSVNTVKGKNGIAIGSGSTVSGENSIAIGTGHTVSGKNSGAFGDPSEITGDGSYAIGNDNSIGAADGFILGNNAEVSYEGGVALGAGSKVLADDAPTAGGFNPSTGETEYTDKTNVWTATTGPVSVGSSEVTRQIKYVAAGSADTDAVNVAQLKAAQVEIIGGDNVEVIKDTSSGHTVYTIHSLNAIVEAGENVAVTPATPETTDKTIGQTTDLTAGETAGTTLEPMPSDNPIEPSGANNHTTTYTVDAADSKVDSVKVESGEPKTTGNKTETEYTVTVTSKEQSVEENKIVTRDVEKTGTFTITDLDTKYEAKQQTESGEDYKEGSTTFTVSEVDGEAVGTGTIEAGENVKITEKDGKAIISAKDTTYTLSYKKGEKAADGSTEYTISLKDKEGNDAGEAIVVDTDTDTQYELSGEKGETTDNHTQYSISLKGTDGSENTFEFLDTRNTVEAGKNVTIDEVKNDDGSFTYTINAAGGGGLAEISFNGDNKDAQIDSPKVLNIEGGATGELSDGNIGVESDGKDTLTIRLAKDIKDVDSITVNKKIKVGDNTTIEGDTVTTKTVNADTVKAGGTTIDDNGLTTDGGNGPSVTKDGIDAGKKKITNVERGTADTDAVNVSQLREASGDIYNELNRLDDRTRKGLAGAAALAALHPMDFNPDDKMQFSAGVGHYRGQNAAAIGAFYRPDESVMFSIGGVIGNGDNMINAGITFGLDGTRNRITRSRTAMAREIQDLRSLVTQMAARMDRLEGANIETAMFPDVPENHWAYEYVEDLQKRGALKGYPDGLFKGDRAMTRYEFAAMLDRLVRSGVTLDSRVAKEFEPELGRIYVERISGQDNDRKKVERVRVNNSDSKYPEGKTRDVYGSKIVTAVPKQA